MVDFLVLTGSTYMETYAAYRYTSPTCRLIAAGMMDANEVSHRRCSQEAVGVMGRKEQADKKKNSRTENVGGRKFDM